VNIVATLLPAPEDVVRLLTDATAATITCVRDGDDLALDTPFVLQDGHLLRAYISVGEETGALVITDGAWAAEQVELFTSRPSIDARWRAMAQIARECGIDFDVEFSYQATGVEAAIGGLSQLARAVDRTLTLLAPTVSRGRMLLRARLRDDMRRAGLHVEQRPRIDLGGLQVRVDYRVGRDQNEAAVELLGGQTGHGATQSVDRAVTNFHLLHGGNYQGTLAAIFDEDSAAAGAVFRERFAAASPADTLLIPSSEAVEVLRVRLAA
jgi:hypothetical protein